MLSSKADEPHPPASLAKMMTLYLVFDGLDRGRFAFDSRWRVSRRAASQPPSKIHLSVGERVSVQDLVAAIVVKSANDAAVTIAEGIAGTENRFARLMTATARRLGMHHSRFVNATGLDRAGQMTTARDMALLARAVLRHFPAHYVQFGRTHMRYRGRYYRTSNRLLRRHWPVDGMKIGYTTRAGYSFVASAQLGERRILAVILGEPSAHARFTQAERLITTGFTRARGNQLRYAQRNGRLRTVRAFSTIDLLRDKTIRVALRQNRRPQTNGVVEAGAPPLLCVVAPARPSGCD